MILFDVDGTLIDSAPGILNTLEEVFTKMSVDVTHVNLRRYLGPPLRKSFGEHFSDPAKIEEATELYRESYREKGSHEGTAYPGAAEMLRRILPAAGSWGTLMFKALTAATVLLPIVVLILLPPQLWKSLGRRFIKLNDKG